jgi:hypothetical protein
MRELDAEIARHERNLREGEARLPVEEQLRLKVRRLLRQTFLNWRAKFSRAADLRRSTYMVSSDEGASENDRNHFVACWNSLWKLSR